MRIPIILGAVAILCTRTATALAAPAWCKGGPALDKPRYDMKSLFSETDPRDALRNLIGATCYPETEIASYAKQIEAMRVAWSKKLGLTDADWVEVNEWAHYPSNVRNNDDFFAKNRQAPWSTSSPLDQYSALNGDTGDTDVAYIADAFGAKLSQLGRLAYLRTCMSRGSQDDGPVAFAMCAPDADGLDMTRIAAEIAADKKYELADRMTARIVAYETLGKLAQFRADAKALRDKDPAYAKMFELGEQIHKSWSADAKTLALMADLDDARVSGSRKASAGCMARAEAAWRAAVEAVPVKKLTAIAAEPGNTFLQQLVPMVIAQPSGYLAALSLNVCAKLENKMDALTRVIGAGLQRWPGSRGPRTATLTAIMTAGLQLDQRDAEIAYQHLHRDWIDGDANVGITGLGAITAVKIEGEQAVVTFQKQKVKQTRCTKGHSTNRLQRITDSGQFIYEYQCDVWINETIEVPPSPPLKVLAKYAAGLTAGMTVSITDDVVAVAYPKNSTTPVLVTGIAVK